MTTEAATTKTVEDTTKEEEEQTTTEAIEEQTTVGTVAAEEEVTEETWTERALAHPRSIEVERGEAGAGAGGMETLSNNNIPRCL